MTQCPTMNFLLSIMTKWLAKHINTRDSFKITSKKGNLFIDIGWPWIWNQCFYLGIWNDGRSKVIVLPSFQLATRLNSQTQMNLSLLINSDTLIFSWILVVPIGIIEVSILRKCFFWLYSVPYTITDLQATENSTYLVGRNGTMWKTCFQLLKCEKRKSAET